MRQVPRMTVTANQKRPDALRMGILGAANIAPPAVIWPAGHMDSIVIAAVAARNIDKATAFAKKHGIPKVHESYQALIEDPAIDVIYNPLPNGYHARWTIEALKNGKHVLCEKPMASNAADAEAMLLAARDNKPVDGRPEGLLLVEAFHYRFHPLARRLVEMRESNAIGKIRHVSTEFKIPFLAFGKDDIRYNMSGKQPELAGGALMDTGCYAMNCLRMLAGSEPLRVTKASAVEAFPGVDSAFEADFVFEGGLTGHMSTNMAAWGYGANAEVRGDYGSISVTNFVAPFAYHRIDVKDSSGRVFHTEKVYGDDSSTYEYMLRAFVGAVKGDPESIALCSFAGSAVGGLLNMTCIDAVYEAAGMKPRQGVPAMPVARL